MSWRTALLIVAFGLGLTYELIAAIGGTDPTISQIVWRANAHPIIPFTLGVIAGHLFWQAKR